jgi:Kef-type K+ transport system membrane component KefB
MFVVSAAAAPLSGSPLLVLLLQLATILALALGLGRLAGRFGLPAVVGELSAGILLGPSVFGALAPRTAAWLLPPDPAQAHLLEAIGQVGVLLLVALVAAQVDLHLVGRRAATVARISSAGLLIPLALGVGAGFLAPAVLLGRGTRPVVFASFLGVVMAVSAIPVIAKTLSDMRLLHRDVGQLALAAGAVDDAVAWILLAVISAIAGAGVGVATVVRPVLGLVAFLIGAALLGRPLIRAALRRAARPADAGAAGPGHAGAVGPVSATVVVAVLVGAAITLALGLEPVLGAFVVGSLIGLPGMVDRRLLAPLRTVVMSVLAPVFLALAGLRVDLSVLGDTRVVLAGLAILGLAVFGKFAGAYLGARLSRLTSWEGVALGAGMNARGIVEIVIASVGLRIGVLNPASYCIVVLVAVVTSLMAPPLLRWSMRRVEHTAAERLRESVDHEDPVAVH